MKEIWIIGIGKFGSIAVRRLSRIYPDTRMVLLDKRKEKLVMAEGSNRFLVHEDGISFLLQHLDPVKKNPDWIIPAIPVHVAAQWIIAKLASEGLERIQIPQEVILQLPNAILGKNGDVYVSFAAFICPDNCPEPGDLCYVTGLKRKQNMYDLLKETWLPGFCPIVVRSHQLAPGVGGYRPEQLFLALQQITGTGDPILLSTACRCHGVMTGLKIHPKRQPI